MNLNEIKRKQFNQTMNNSNIKKFKVSTNKKKNIKNKNFKKNTKIANLYVTSRFKNTILRLNKINNGLYKQWSTKSFKSRSKKNTLYNIEKMSRDLNIFLKKKKISKLNIFLNGNGFGRRHILKNLNKFSKYKNRYKKTIFKTGFIFQITPKVFNGCRLRAPKRK